MAYIPFLNNAYFSAKVGIGTDSPDAKLDVHSSINISNPTSTVSEFADLNLRTYSSNWGYRQTKISSTLLDITTGNNRLDFTIADASVTGTDIVAMSILSANGNVGIGTTSPAGKLEVNGGAGVYTSGGTFIVRQSADSNSSGIALTSSNALSHRIWKNAAGDLNIGSSSNPSALVQLINGNIGIGTTSPSQKLEVSGNIKLSTRDDKIMFGSGGTSPAWSAPQIARIGSTMTMSDYSGVQFGGYDGTSYGPRMTVLGTGNVGIGTTSPGHLLHVYAGDGVAVNSYTALVQNAEATAGDNFGLKVQAGKNSSDVTMEVSNAAGSSYMRVRGDGNVGIGTTAPAAKLDVQGGGGVPIIANSTQDYLIGLYRSGTAEWFLKAYTNGNFALHENGISDRFTIKAGGNVGIGDTTPEATLTVKKGSEGAYFSAGGDTANNRQLVFTSSNGNGSNGAKHQINATSSNGIIALATANVDRLTVGNTGNVGIGTTTPGYKLSVSGNIGLTDGVSTGLLALVGGNYYIQNTGAYSTVFQTNGAERMRIDSSGNVGIGTTSPAAKLDVQGTGNFTGLVSGITPVAAANFVTKAYADGLTPGAGVFLPLAGGTMTGSIKNGDSVYSYWGAGDDLQIGHDGSNSYIIDKGVGDLLLYYSDDFVVSKYGTSEISIRANQDSSVELFFDNTKKFETTSTGVLVAGDIQIDSALLSNQENTDVDTGTEAIASVVLATYTAAFFDFVIKKGTNVRSGTVYACHDGTNVEFTETSTNDLGDTSDVTLSVDISGTNMRLLATVTSDDWSVKSLIRAI
mgnify:CR=1 FL=1